MEFVFEPDKFKKRLMLNPKNPEQVEKRAVFAHAITLKSTFEVVDHPEYFLKIRVTEANRKVSTIEIYMDKLIVCSCEEYTRKECGICKHTAVLQFMRKIHPGHKFSRYINESIKDLRISSENSHIVYESLKDIFYRIGVGERESESCSCTTKRKIMKSYDTSSPTVPYDLPEPFILNDGRTLYPYQNDILASMMTAKNAICCMIMGAGKTLTSIAGIQTLASENGLIVCPKTVMDQWEREIRTVLGKSITYITGKNAEQFSGSKEGIGICTYQTFARNSKILGKRKFKFVIADEIQFIRNEESKTWAAFKRIKTEYFWGLSGTVIENRLDDLYSVMEIVSPGRLGAKWKFDSKFKVIRSIHTSKVLYENEIQNIPELRKMISGNVFSHVDIGLKDPTHNFHYVSMDSDARDKHDWYMFEVKKLVSKSLNSPLTFGEKAYLQSLRLRARQCCNTLELIDGPSDSRNESQKVDMVVEIISESVREGRKIVVFSEWTGMLNIIQKKLSTMKDPIGNSRLDGSMTSPHRRAAVDRFVSDPDCWVFFSSDAGGIGLDGLQGVCHTMLHIELPWNPGKLDQRIGRLNRIGQDSVVDVHYIVTEDSIESRIESLIEEKRSVRNDTLFS